MEWRLLGDHSEDLASSGQESRSARRPDEWTVRYALIAYLASWLVIGLVSVKSPFGLRLPAGSGALAIDCAWLLALLPLYPVHRIGISDLGLRRSPSALSAGLVLLTVLGYRWVTQAWYATTGPAHVVSPFLGLSDQTAGVIVTFGLAATISPVVEEVFFRGLIYRAFRNRLSLAPASLLVGAMFAVIHTEYPLAILPDLFFLGVALCLLYEYTGSLLPGIAVNLYLDLGAFENGLTGYSHIVKGVFVLLIVAFALTPQLPWGRRRTT